jgi:2-phospho-L-lactate transferase/gluconeogenesis factor (CofD/UPF0052 family)
MRSPFLPGEGEKDSENSEFQSASAVDVGISREKAETDTKEACSNLDMDRLGEMQKMITALAGGVGAARFLQGLITIVPPEELTVIVNTGDGIEFFGQHVSPDIDIIIYTLTGIVDEERGWGIRGDTFNCLEMLKQFGSQIWFGRGDKDFWMSSARGFSLSQVTSFLCKS